MEKQMPVFVKVNDYKDVREVLELLNKKLEEAKANVARINELKNQEDNELELWQNELAQIERKLAEINASLAAPNI